MEHGKSFTGRIFSVMRRREDLPEMTLPLAIVFLMGMALFSAAAAKLATPLETASAYVYFDPADLVGTVAAIPFLPLAACLYALLILLWRRAASLLATPAAFLLMLAFGADLFSAITISVSLFFISYVYAVSLISRENRFRRVASLALATSACLILCVVAWIGVRFDSFSDFASAYMDEVPTVLGDLFTQFYEQAASGAATAAAAVVLPESYLNSVARELLIMCPAYLGVLSIALAWFVDFLARTAFRILDCEDVFIEITDKITLPFSYAVVYAAVMVLSLLTPAEESPMLYAMLRSVLLVMLLPCAAVGVARLMHILEDRLYYLTRERLLAAMILIFAVTFLGIFPFLVIASAVGVAAVIRNRMKKDLHSEE